MTRLSPHARQALQQALRDGGELRRTFTPGPGRPPWPAHAATLHSLVRRGLMDRTERLNRRGAVMWIWTITDAGRQALEPVQRLGRDTVLSMRSKGAARSRVVVGGVWVNVSQPEPEKVDVARLKPEWAIEAKRRHAEAEDARDGAARLAGRLRAA